MKILLVSFDFLPHAVGGTEVYVAGLARELKAMGHHVRIAITRDRHKDYNYKKIPVDVLRTGTTKLFRYLDEMAADIVHFHPIYLTQVLPVMEVASRLSFPTLCTYHAPTITCGRGDMMRWDKTCCDGFTELNKCTACVLHQKGMFKSPASAIAKLVNSTPLRHATPRRHKWLLQKIHTMLSIPSQRTSQLEEWGNAVQVIDHWVAPAIWVQEVLKGNGVNSDRIMISRQGLVQSALDFTKTIDQTPEITTQDYYHFKEFSGNNSSTPLRLGYLGRIHHHKGVHVMVDAMGCLREFPNISLKIAGEAADSQKKYEDRAKMMSQKDPRIHWQGAVRPENVGHFLHTLDALVVPSIWMETGPLTVLEAWAAGVPILGSKLGGIAEWINEYGGGWLFEPGNAEDLAKAIRRLIDNPALLKCVEIPARVRNMTDVAREMVDLYDALLTKKVTPDYSRAKVAADDSGVRIME